MLVDQDSLANIIFIDAFNKLDMSMEKVGLFHSTLIGIAGVQVWVKGYIELLMTFSCARTIPIKFLIVECKSPFNAILGRPFLNKLAAIMSTPYLTIKFPLLNGEVSAIHANQREVRQYYMDCLRIKGGESLPSRASQMLNSRVTNINLAEVDLKEDFKEKRGQLER